MKTYILLPLALLSCASAALTENKPFQLATVLFYNDGYGHQVVAAGRVPRNINAAIRRDINNRISNATVKVAPVLYRLKGAPVAEEIIGFVKEKFNHVYLTVLPKSVADKVVYDKSVKIRNMNLKYNKNFKLDDVDKDTKNNEVVNTNSISEGNKDDRNMFSVNDLAPAPKTYYIPNTVFYAVEIKCKTPTDLSCYSNKGPRSHGKTSNKSFNITKAPINQNTNNLFKKLFRKTKFQSSQD